MKSSREIRSAWPYRWATINGSATIAALRASLRRSIRRPVSRAQLAANGIVLALALWLFRPVYPYLGIIFTRQEFRTNQIVLIGVLGLLILQLRGKQLHFRPDAPLRWRPAALGMALGAATLFVLAERYLDINTLSASLFGLTCYGLLGLWMSPSRWRQGLPAALLLVGVLPFGDHMQTFIGYPVRLLTAAIVREGFSALGVHSIGIDTILIFENGVSQVDLPCSGVKSLWTGGLFLLAATWLERRPLSLRWLGVALAFAVLLLGANLARVGVLVGVGEVAGWRLAAEMLHVPLGVLGFAAACGAVTVLLRRAWGPEDGSFPAFDGSIRQEMPSFHAIPTPGDDSSWERMGFRGVALLLTGGFLLLSLFYTPRPTSAEAPDAQRWVFPADLRVEAWPLTPGELAWLGSGGALAGDRWRFNWQGYRGSILFVTSDSWRAHHRPERCFEVYGLSVKDAGAAMVDLDFPLRLLSLEDPHNLGRYAAVYWYQSSEGVTDDYATRIWADLAPERQPWVLVTILFDEPYEPTSEELISFYPAVRTAVAAGLGGGKP